MEMPTEEIATRKPKTKTETFCSKYLTRRAPTNRKIIRFVEGYKSGELMDGVDFDAVGIRIRRMKYADFLITPYWIAISDIVKNKYKKCQRCGSRKQLEVHHTTYDHHGDELNHMEDLVCLCHNCHAQIHNKR